MALHTRSVAIQGIGINALAMALDGFVASAQVQPPVVVPPKKKPQRPTPQPSSGGGGGGGVVYLSDVVSPQLRPWVSPLTVPEEEEGREEAADLVLLHPATAPIKALADGVVETFLDNHGRPSMVLIADDGTRYWYADVGGYGVESGERVRSGAVIGRTKPGAPTAPEIAAGVEGGRPALPEPGARGSRRRRPLQPVFVSPPPPLDVSGFIAPFRPIPAPASALPPRRLVRLVPIRPEQPASPRTFLGETIQAPETSPPPVARVALPALAVVAVLALIAARWRR